MAAKVTLGMVRLWESMLDQAVSGVMAKVNMVESRGTVLARYQIEDEYGISKLRDALSKAEAVVDEISTRLNEMGVETRQKYPNRNSKRALDAAIEERAKSFHPAQVQAFVAEVQQAKEQIRLSVLPVEVKAILDSIRESSNRIVPLLSAAEVEVQGRIAERAPDATDED